MAKCDPNASIGIAERSMGGLKLLAWSPVPPDTSTASLPKRVLRKQRNDALVLDAVEQVLAQEGWANLSVRSIAHAASVSEQLVRNRSTDARELAGWYFRERGAPILRAQLEGLIGTLSLEDATPAPDPDVAAACFAPFADANVTLRAAMELVLVANVDAELRAVVVATLAAFLDTYVRPHREPEQAALAAQRAYAIARALGLVLIARLDTVAGSDFDVVGHAFAAVVKRVGAPRGLPRTRARHLDGWFPFDTGSERRDALLRAASTRSQA